MANEESQSYIAVSVADGDVYADIMSDGEHSNTDVQVRCMHACTRMHIHTQTYYVYPVVKCGGCVGTESQKKVYRGRFRS